MSKVFLKCIDLYVDLFICSKRSKMYCKSLKCLKVFTKIVSFQSYPMLFGEFSHFRRISYIHKSLFHYQFRKKLACIRSSLKDFSSYPTSFQSVHMSLDSHLYVLGISIFAVLPITRKLGGTARIKNKSGPGSPPGRSLPRQGEAAAQAVADLGLPRVQDLSARALGPLCISSQ